MSDYERQAPSFGIGELTRKHRRSVPKGET